jgi:hypothetical protein
LEGGPVERVKQLVVFQALDPAPLVATGDGGAQLASRLGVSGPVVPVLGQDPLATEDVDAGVTAPRCGMLFDDVNLLLKEADVVPALGQAPRYDRGRGRRCRGAGCGMLFDDVGALTGRACGVRAENE